MARGSAEVTRLTSRTTESLSAEEARRIILRAQGLHRPPSAEDSVEAVLSRLGAVQLDTISVLARSHELVAYARLGPVPRASIEEAYWGEPARAFEYMGHAACIMPLELWPYFAFRRRAVREREDERIPAGFFDEARGRLRDGPVSTSDIGGARGRAGWWDWTPGKRALEGLYRRGEVVVTLRRGWKRIYDLPERALPAKLLEHDPTDEECYRHLVVVAARAVGVGTAHDIGGYFNLPLRYTGVAPDARRLIAASIEAAGLVPVAVEGWREPAFADPAALADPPEQPSRTTLVSPFDSLIWASARSGELKERERARRIFDFSYSFEAYVPEDQRRHGYFTMPLLAGGRLVGHVDPKREGKRLLARRVTLENPEAAPAAATALREAAAWVGCEEVVVGDVRPAAARAALQAAL